MDDNERRFLVFRGLDNSRDNGFDESTETTEAIAADMTTCDAELEQEEPASLYPHIDAWFIERGVERKVSNGK